MAKERKRVLAICGLKEKYRVLLKKLSDVQLLGLRKRNEN